MSEGDSKSPVQVDLGAKAELKIGLETRIPEKSTGRLVDALTDIIRPLSESRGLKADLIRLQREDVAIKIALKARERLQIEAEEIRPVPTKLLVPILEAASLEDPEDDAMHELWANLLASASTTTNVEPRFPGILKELHTRQAVLIERIARNNAPADDKHWRRQLCNAPTDFDSYILTDRFSELQQNGALHNDAEAIFDGLYGWLNSPGCAPVDVIISMPGDEGGWWSLPSSEAFGAVDNALDLGILASLGILQKCSGVTAVPRGPRVVVLYYCFTELGVSFYSACNNFGLNE